MPMLHHCRMNRKTLAAASLLASAVDNDLDFAGHGWCMHLCIKGNDLMQASRCCRASIVPSSNKPTW